MILVDTSVWVAFMNGSCPALAKALESGQVLCHPFILGELACGNLANRTQILHDLEHLPKAVVASHLEVLVMIEKNELNGKSIGWVDMHLLASTLLTSSKLWTLDKQLNSIAELLSCIYPI